jgi:hypothetical protein
MGFSVTWALSWQFGRCRDVRADFLLVDVSNVTDVRLKTGCAIHSRSPNLVSKLSFSLMSGGEFSLLDLDAIHAAQLAEWTDGIRVLRGDGGMMSGESANYVHVSDCSQGAEAGPCAGEG